MARYLIRKHPDSSRQPDQWLAGLHIPQFAGFSLMGAVTWVDNAEFAMSFATYDLASATLEVVTQREEFNFGRYDIVASKTPEEFYL